MGGKPSLVKNLRPSDKSDKRFFSGILLIVFSFILGKIALPLFALEFRSGLVVYTFSWLLFAVGFAMCGKKGWHYLKSWYGNRKEN